MLPEFQWFQWRTLPTKWVPDIDTDSQYIDDYCGSLFQKRVSDPDSEKRPEKYSRNDIRPISTLELWDDQKESSKREDRIVIVSRSSEWPTHRAYPDSYIERCRHDDPGKCDLYTRSDYERWATSKGEYIGKKCEYRKHDDECHADVEIAPRYEPNEC